jgi:uncharacterized protein YukE
MRLLTKEERALVNWGILMALFKATNEQTDALNQETKQHTKMLFNDWKGKGEMLFKQLDRILEPEVKVIIDECTDAIHDAISEIKSLNRMDDESN